MKALLIAIACLLIFPYGISGNFGKEILSEISLEIEIPPGDYFYVHFNSSTLRLEKGNLSPLSKDLPIDAKIALTRVPRWLRLDLIRQLKEVRNPNDYANLLMKVNEKYLDEIAFCIAHSPLGKVPSPEIILDNVKTLYLSDDLLSYADILDYKVNGERFSTISYKVLKDGKNLKVEIPPSIYYWFVVHPKITSGDVKRVYGKLWRDYLLFHNDIGYPLLIEKLSGIKYLWDYKAYYEPPHRTWKWCIENHPTAIEAVSYWVGKSVPENAYGSRPIQPNVIYHEHNGWCGELRIIAVAGLRSALVPAVGISAVGEDHVWREFYIDGWHENDNWWADGGGAVDKPDTYAYGWGRNLSALFAWKGDDSIYEVTSRYLHERDLKRVTFVVLDQNMEPVDGARVMVIVKGPFDTTWYKNKLLELIQEVWEKLPPLLKGGLMESIYKWIICMCNKLPNSTEWFKPCIWNYTDMRGRCSFTLGVNKSYLFVIQRGFLENPLLAKQNRFYYMEKPRERTIPIIFFTHRQKLKKTDLKVGREGEIQISIKFNSQGYQFQKNIFTGNLGKYMVYAFPSFFIVDKENFEKFRKGKSFKCYLYTERSEGELIFPAEIKDWYIVFKNRAFSTFLRINFTIRVLSDKKIDVVQIVKPSTAIWNIPWANVGDEIELRGICNGEINLFIDGEKCQPKYSLPYWTYRWNTSGTAPGTHVIEAVKGSARDKMLINLVDASPPTVVIEGPRGIVDAGIIKIWGKAKDNVGIKEIEAYIDGKLLKVNGKERWEFRVNLTEPGVYKVRVKVEDFAGKVGYDQLEIIVNESDHEWGPVISDVYHYPSSPSNESNVIVYANVSCNSPFGIDRVILYIDDGRCITSKVMYRYGDNPVQNRSEEDPLKNISNSPRYGVELGQLPSGSKITYWVVAYDKANNSASSEKKILEVDI
ncbi:MAG: hypothetical protein J7L20_00925 [Thermoplasmata archaeon]|nr:hypothetical protein [Thermoplasmata archaeon]